MRSIVLSLVILAILSGCSSGNRVTVEDPTISDVDIQHGRTFFMKDCAACHGEKLDGLGDLADRLPVKPASLIRATDFKHGSELDDLATTIKYGIPNTPMVHGFQSLYVEEDIIKIAKFVYSMRQK